MYGGYEDRDWSRDFAASAAIGVVSAAEGRSRTPVRVCRVEWRHESVAEGVCSGIGAAFLGVGDGSMPAAIPRKSLR